MIDDAMPHKAKYYNQPLMQFTGLRDKNGIEIYEGDILGGYPHGTAWVEWDSEYACFISAWNLDEFADDGNPHAKKETSLLANELSDCKDAWVVIGNIYENPDLIK